MQDRRSISVMLRLKKSVGQYRKTLIAAIVFARAQKVSLERLPGLTTDDEIEFDRFHDVPEGAHPTDEAFVSSPDEAGKSEARLPSYRETHQGMRNSLAHRINHPKLSVKSFLARMAEWLSYLLKRAIELIAKQTSRSQSICILILLSFSRSNEVISGMKIPVSKILGCLKEACDTNAE